MTEAVRTTLTDLAFFQGISESHLQRLADISRIVEFPARTEIFHERDQARDVYVIRHGRVSLVICEPKVGCRQLMEISDGELFGWSPLVGRTRLTDSAQTITATEAICVDAQKLLEICREDTEFGFEFMHRTAKVLAERLAATRLQLLNLSGFRLPDIQIESD